MPHLGREPVLRSRSEPTGQVVAYPTCTDWACDDDHDWDVVGPEDEDYAAIKRERDIALYHEPRDEWRQRLSAERQRLSGGDPLWWGRPRKP